MRLKKHYNKGMKTNKYLQDTIAMVYDFDGTLTPEPMQNYAILPKLGINAAEFWQEVGAEVSATGAENMLVYMRKLLEKAQERKVHIRQQDYAELASKIKYFPGVASWFERINNHLASQSSRVKIKHYVVSAGMLEILNGVEIGKHFAKIYASEYFFDHRGVATFPKLVITDTSKTQFLFRINKGIEDLSQSINEHMPEAKRPIPFSNIIYIGDGLSDVPSMALCKKEGGHTIAVYRPDQVQQKKVCQQLLRAKRADFIAAADYRQSGLLYQMSCLLLNKICAEIEYKMALHESNVKIKQN